MKLLIQFGKEVEWTIPFLQNPAKYLGGEVDEESRQFPEESKWFDEREEILEKIRGKINREGTTLDERIAAVARWVDSKLEPFAYAQPEIPHKVEVSIVPHERFYVRLITGFGKISDPRMLRQSMKPELVKEMWQSLPKGYGVGVSNDFLGGREYLENARTELVDIEILGNTRGEVLTAFQALKSSGNYRRFMYSSSDDSELREGVKRIRHNRVLEGAS